MMKTSSGIRMFKFEILQHIFNFYIYQLKIARETNYICFTRTCNPQSKFNPQTVVWKLKWYKLMRPTVMVGMKNLEEKYSGNAHAWFFAKKDVPSAGRQAAQADFFIPWCFTHSEHYVYITTSRQHHYMNPCVIHLGGENVALAYACVYVYSWAYLYTCAHACVGVRECKSFWNQRRTDRKTDMTLTKLKSAH